MARSERLLELLQILRRHRRPVSGAVLAAEAGVSLRTLYRDIDSLRAQGAVIDGEAGVGYVLKPGYLLPPLMFSDEEVEALVLGSRWVARRTDEPLAAAAREALAKIGAVLPPALAERIEMSALFVGPSRTAHADLSPIRQAIRNERKLAIRYDDGRGAVSERIIWPLALAFFDETRRRVVVRAAPGLPAFPDGQDRSANGDRRAVSAAAPGAAERMAEGKRHRSAGVTLLPETVSSGA